MAVRKDRGPINQAVKTDLKNSVLCWLATVDPTGVPNVTPEEIFASDGDDRVVIADIASSNSVRNIRLQPKCLRERATGELCREDAVGCVDAN